MIAIQSDSLADLASALVKVSMKLQHAVKDAKNPHFKNDYATLESVIDATKQPLAEEGLVILQTTHAEGQDVTLITTLLHSSGQWMRSFTPVMNEKKNAQGMGSGLSYARRYALAAIAGISQTDDDGNEASTKNSATGQKFPNAEVARSLPSGPITRDVIILLVKKFKWAESDVRSVIQEHFKAETSNDLTAAQYAELAKIISTQTGDGALGVIRARNKALAAREANALPSPSSDFLTQPEPSWDDWMDETKEKA